MSFACKYNPFQGLTGTDWFLWQCAITAGSEVIYFPSIPHFCPEIRMFGEIKQTIHHIWIFPECLFFWNKCQFHFKHNCSATAQINNETASPLLGNNTSLTSIHLRQSTANYTQRKLHLAWKWVLACLLTHRLSASLVPGKQPCCEYRWDIEMLQQWVLHPPQAYVGPHGPTIRTTRGDTTSIFFHII